MKEKLIIILVFFIKWWIVAIRLPGILKTKLKIRKYEKSLINETGVNIFGGRGDRLIKISDECYEQTGESKIPATPDGFEFIKAYVDNAYIPQKKK